MEYFNEMEVVFDSRSENEGFARVAVGCVYDADGSGSGGSGRREDSGLRSSDEQHYSWI